MYLTRKIALGSFNLHRLSPCSHEFTCCHPPATAIYVTILRDITKLKMCLSSFTPQTTFLAMFPTPSMASSWSTTSVQTLRNSYLEDTKKQKTKRSKTVYKVAHVHCTRSVIDIPCHSGRFVNIGHLVFGYIALIIFMLFKKFIH